MDEPTKEKAIKHFNATPEHNASTCILAFDISRDKFNVFTRIAGREQDIEFANSTPVIETELRTVAARARTAGAERVLVVAESTGPYHRPKTGALYGDYTQRSAPELIAYSNPGEWLWRLSLASRCAITYDAQYTITTSGRQEACVRLRESLFVHSDFEATRAEMLAVGSRSSGASPTRLFIPISLARASDLARLR